MNTLDFAKVLAMLWIMLVHLAHGWFGWQGVHLFITLGGFTLTYACLQKEKVSWRAWAGRRAARILPSYWATALAGFVVVVLLEVVAPLSKQPFEIAAQAWKLITDLTFFRNLSYRTMLADPNSALWFIGLTVSFYLLFPLLFQRLRTSANARSVLMFVAVLCACEFAYRAWAIYFLDGAPVGYGHGFIKALTGRTPSALQHVADDFPFQLWSPFGLAPSRIGEYGFGMAAAVAFVKDGERFKRLVFHPAMFAAGFAVWLVGNALLYAGRWGWIFADFALAVGLTIWVVNLARLVGRASPLTFRFFSWLGVWSYYLFLTHLLVGYAVARLYMMWTTSAARVMLMIIAASVTIVLACRLLRRLDNAKLFEISSGERTGKV